MKYKLQKYDNIKKSSVILPL